MIRINGVSNVPPNNTSYTHSGRKLPDNIADIINDNEFWSVLFQLQDLLYPLCGFLNKIQKDSAKLYEVLHCFGYVLKIFKSNSDISFSRRIINRLEKRWKDWEQPLLILSMVLHPLYKHFKFKPSIPNLSFVHLGQMLKYYYEAWFNKKPISILSEFMVYIKGEDPYDYNSFSQFKNNLISFWEFTSGIGPELAQIAIRIHGISINSASVERMWSSMGHIHTIKRNRLNVCTYLFYLESHFKI